MGNGGTEWRKGIGGQKSLTKGKSRVLKKKRELGKRLKYLGRALT
jgi:hypothetical protein